MVSNCFGRTVRNMRSLAILLLLLPGGAACSAQPIPDGDPAVVLRISIVGDQREFHIGETIPLRLAFSSDAKNHYQVDTAQYDRSGRMTSEHFNITPASGAVDPLADYSPGIGGGLRGFQFLTTKPWTITLNLNEWVRFTRPGEYRLVVSSTRVSVRDPSSPFGASQVTSRSNEIPLTIVPASRKWQIEVLKQAVIDLNVAEPISPQDLEQYARKRKQALETLRFLGTPEATRELAKWMRADANGAFDYICMLGLISSPYPDTARGALEEELAKRDHPIDGNFLAALKAVSSASNGPGPNWREQQRKAVEELLAVLPNKQGKALSVSLRTAAYEAWNAGTLPKQTTDALAQALIARFDQLPASDQRFLLTDRWDKIASPSMLPILRRYAESYHYYPNSREIDAPESLQVSSTALQRWYELDPAGARPAIIREITRPRPRYDARVLGMLPDKTLPEVDSALAEHFVASNDVGGSANLASLIARYATEAILPQVTFKLDSLIGKWSCAIQSPILAYLLRVSPELARPRINEALAHGEFGCSHEMFQEISEITYNPVLEEIGIRGLDDPDPRVAMTAATMLGKFGSAAAEAPLWQRYTVWAAAWEGREADLDLTLADDTGDRGDQLGLGQNLMMAIATGKSWLTDGSKLRQLSHLTKVRRVRDQLDRFVDMWKSQPLDISFSENPAPAGFQARVAQYHFRSMEALEEKLAQFPAQTKFALSVSYADLEERRSLSELRSVLAKHNLFIAGEKTAQ